ncbi:MAG: hypothetical protein PVF50_04685 [Gammaproteobacteria bacterium]|jgi:hypothetical protein
MLFASALALSSYALAQDDEPSLDFLEYLGSWEADDEPWYVEVQIDAVNGGGKEAAGDSSPKESRAEHDDG